MTGIENHLKPNAPTSLSNELGVVGAVLQIIVALMVIIGAGLHWMETVIKAKR